MIDWLVSSGWPASSVGSLSPDLPPPPTTSSPSWSLAALDTRLVRFLGPEVPEAAPAGAAPAAATCLLAAATFGCYPFGLSRDMGV